MKSEITPVINYVFFQVEKETEDLLETKIGALYIDTRFDTGRHAKICGHVIGVPQKLTDSITMWREEEGLPMPVTYYSGEMTAQMAPILKAGMRMTAAEEKEADRRIIRDYYDPSSHEPAYKTLADIVPEVQVGDKIYFHYNTVHEENRIRTEDGRKIYKVRYDQIFCSVRNGQIIPIGGWVLMEPAWDEETQEIQLQGQEKVRGKVSASGLVTELHDKPKPLEGIIANIGTQLKGDPELGVKNGDRVFFLPLSEFKNKIEGKEYYIMRQKDIIAKIG